MADRTVPTVTLAGKSEYARVPERIKLFREDCPHGSIQTQFTTMEDGQISFEATVVKDRSDPESAMATGHSLGPIKGDKSFEKLETVSVGRALAMLGYLASGEVASFEEMEEYYDKLKEEKAAAIADAIDQLGSAKTLDALKKIFVSLGVLIKEPQVVEAKDKRKEELNDSEAN